MHNFVLYLTVALSGAFGAVARFALLEKADLLSNYILRIFQSILPSFLVNSLGQYFISINPTAFIIMFVNILGSFLIGIFFAILKIKGMHEIVKLIIFTGILSSFTTFSSIWIDVFTIYSKANIMLGLMYFALTIFVSFSLFLFSFNVTIFFLKP